MSKGQAKVAGVGAAVKTDEAVTEALKKSDASGATGQQLTAINAGGGQVTTMINLEELEAASGQGLENVTADDRATPIISVLQAQSPQCKRSDGKYIAAAKEGMLYNNVTNEVYDGETGIIVVPCFFEKVFIEWKPNRGGLVAIHDAMTPLRDQVKMLKTPDGKEVPTLPNGNNLIETNQHFVLMVKPDGSYDPAVIAMSSSALKSSRLWNSLMSSVKRTKADGTVFILPSFATFYKLTTKARTKDQYSWFGWAIEPAGPVNLRELFSAGQALCKQVSAGNVRVKQEQVDEPAAVSSEEAEIPY